MLKFLRKGDLRRQRGFTLVGTTISFMIAAVALTGAWIAYHDMQIQLHVASADRMMDQYAQATFQELTNVLSWSWGSDPFGNQAWKFYMDDVVEEWGLFETWTYRTENNMLLIGYRPNTGLLINNVQPKWARDRSNWYKWTGSRPPVGKTAAIDRRDRITMEALRFDRVRFDRFPTSDPVSEVKREGVMKVWMTMHYSYTAPNWNRIGTRLFVDRYVRERYFETKIAMHNYDVSGNPFRDSKVVAHGG